MSTPNWNEPTISRRGLLGSAAALATSASILGGMNVLAADAPKPATTGRKIKVGLIGCGGRGNWLMPLFLKHGGYELHALADYFPERRRGGRRQVRRRPDAPLQRTLGL